MQNLYTRIIQNLKIKYKLSKQCKHYTSRLMVIVTASVRIEISRQIFCGLTYVTAAITAL